jgi:arsenical pump membrane protein
VTVIAAALPDALRQSWPPFVLVAGLLLVGVVAASDGLFETVGARLARLPGGGKVLFASLMALVAAVTVVLNLDTSVVFLTPIVLHTARQRGIDETAFLYGVVFMSNSASLLLPGSNLTNLLVLAPDHSSGTAVAARMLPAWIAAVAVTLLVVFIWRRRDLRSPGVTRVEAAPLRVGFGLAGVVAATVLVLVLGSPALPVFCVGVLCGIGQIVLHRVPAGTVRSAVNAVTLSGLFVLAVALGTLARAWGAPGRLTASIGPWATAWLGAGTASVVNNLPAAVLLSSRPPAHVQALLVGLDLGPNLVVIGALSAILWLRVARAEEAAPSALTYSKVGVVLVPLSITAALLALQLFGTTAH